jgi:hypothetical protein
MSEEVNVRLAYESRVPEVNDAINCLINLLNY